MRNEVWVGQEPGTHKHTHTDRVNSICPSTILRQEHTTGA